MRRIACQVLTAPLEKCEMDVELVRRILADQRLQATDAVDRV